MARIIHQASPRRNKALVSVNCGLLPEAFLESELFGHERGAFAGANQRKVGVIEQADGGTLCFDAIDALPMALQVKLLHFRQTGKFERIGGTGKIHADVRLIAATHKATYKDLKAEVEANRFQRDLFDRLSVISLEFPPLRGGKDDIPVLVDRFLEEHAKKHNRPIPTLSPEAMDALMAYSWPSNVRELHGAIERAVVLCDDGKIEVEHLPEALTEK